MKKTAILLMFFTMLSKLLGFGRDVTLSYFYGTSFISDAYIIAITVPTVVFAFVGVGISTGYIPMFNKVEKYEGKIESNKFTNNLINTTIVISSIILVFCLIFTEQIVNIFASGFEGEVLRLTVQLTKISIIGIYFTGLVHIFKGFLQIKGNYIIPGMIGLPLNIIIIISIFISNYTNPVIMAIGTVVGLAFQLVLMVPFAKKKGYKYNLLFNIKDKYIKRMGYIAIPVIIGASINQINVLVDRTLASQIIEGGISALNYSQKLTGLVQGVFVVSIATLLYPLISKMALDKDIKGLKHSVMSSINGINLLVIPSTFIFMLFAEPLVELFFGRGAFNEQSVFLTSSSLFFYAIGMVGFGLRDVISKAFYSLEDTKTPMINASLALCLNIVLNIILSKYLGIAGLALATSISTNVCAMLLIISLRKKIGTLGLKRVWISAFKILLASITMSLIALYSYKFLMEKMNDDLALILIIPLGGFVYFICIYFLKLEETKTVTEKIKNKLKIK